MPTANRFRSYHHLSGADRQVCAGPPGPGLLLQMPPRFRTSDRPSRTAEYMALFRAVETAQHADRRLFEDPYAAPLLTGRLKALAGFARLPLAGRLATHLLDLGWPRTRSSAVVRTRLIDDLVRQAIRGGACQALLLGAGFDSRPIAWTSSGTCRCSRSIIPPRRRPSASAWRRGSGGCPATFISCRWISRRTTWKPRCCTRASTRMSRRWPFGKV